ncbi:MAG: MBL fold metallo-hydrolase [Parabacteroides sp.]|nr:MBL fold metallo-hydrolase [Parabacteroides sp.]MDY6005330.1 MBL fold metallo-hydrolase [Parabacteroides sp.]
MKVTFLGTGTSTGVPEIGCSCAVCQSNDPRDNRLRASVLVETAGKRILIDCGPDFRQQMIRSRIYQLDGILLTHEHYDHVGGLDDLRPYCRQGAVPIYAELDVVEAIETRIPYVFRAHPYPGVPRLALHTISLEPFEVAGVLVQPIRVMHGRLPILGFRIGNFAYLTDILTLPETEVPKLQGVDVLVLDALREAEHPSHESVPQALALIDRLQPKQAYLTHMSHRIGLHAVAEQSLPAHVQYAYDGLEIELVSNKSII